MVDDCKHEHFHVHLSFAMMEDTGARTVDITAKCEGCGEPLRFLGLPVGASFHQPTTSPDGVELRAPFVVGSEKPPEGAPGFMIGLRVPEDIH